MRDETKNEFSVFSRASNLEYGLSTQRDGPMNIKAAGDFAVQAALNRSTFLNQSGFRLGDTVVNPLQEHGCHVGVVQAPCPLIHSPRADGLFTTSRRMWLTVRTADCRVGYMYDPATGGIGLFHCGWRGALVHKIGIVESMVQAFMAYRSKPRDIRLGIGPGLCLEHFLIRNDVSSYFYPYSSYLMKCRAEHWHVDFGNIVSEQARKMGLIDENIEVSEACTYCLGKHTLYSQRRWRDKGLPDPVPNMMAYMVKI